MDEAFLAARSPHRGPAFVDVPMDEFFNSASGPAPQPPERQRIEPDGDALTKIAGLLAEARQPVLILGTDVWADGAEEAALRFVQDLGIPTLTNGMGRGIVPGGHELLVTKARSVALGGADLVVVVGTPLDFRLGYGVFGGKEEGSTPARVVHVADSPGQVATHAELAGSVSGDLTAVFDGLQAAAGARREAGLVGVAVHARRHRRRGRRARRRAARRRGRPDPPGADLRRAGAAARRRRGGDRRRRRLRQLRRQVRRAEAARRLAGPRPLRLPRRRPGRGDRGPARAAVVAGGAAARRRRGRLLADGRRHDGPPQPAGRHGDGQQLRVGAGEGPDADALRLRRDRRPGSADAVRRGRARRSAAAARP